MALANNLGGSIIPAGNDLTTVMLEVAGASMVAAAAVTTVRLSITISPSNLGKPGGGVGGWVGERVMKIEKSDTIHSFHMAGPCAVSPPLGAAAPRSIDKKSRLFECKRKDKPDSPFCE